MTTNILSLTSSFGRFSSFYFFLTCNGKRLHSKIQEPFDKILREVKLMDRFQLTGTLLRYLDEFVRLHQEFNNLDMEDEQTLPRSSFLIAKLSNFQCFWLGRTLSWFGFTEWNRFLAVTKAVNQSNLWWHNSAWTCHSYARFIRSGAPCIANIHHWKSCGDISLSLQIFSNIGNLLGKCKMVVKDLVNETSEAIKFGFNPSILSRTQECTLF